MHRIILGITDTSVHVDHINGCCTDNRRQNLRLVSRTQNMMNRHVKRGRSSGFKGVYLHKHSGRWRASIGLDGKKIHLGGYATPDEAARCYDAAARQHFGAFARLNFPAAGEQSAITRVRIDTLTRPAEEQP